jgi:nitrite reductase (NO-forming)
MKSALLLFAIHKPQLFMAALIAFLAGVTQSPACEGCNVAMVNRLLYGEKPSRHATEILSLINNAEGTGAAALRESMALLASASPNAAQTSIGGTYPGLTLNNDPALTVASRTPALASPRGQRRPAPAPAPQRTFNIEDHEFRDIIERDRKLGIPETSYVPPGTKPDKQFTITMEEGEVSLGNGVIYSGFTVNGTIPGPTLIMEEGDVVELTVVNNGEVPHGVSLHAVYTQTSKYYGRINPGESKTHIFRVNHPGVYMYHCAPGGHAIPMHTLQGQYGMMVVKPKLMKFRMDEVMGRAPDLEIFLLQHELYCSGKNAVEGKAAYVMFNGSLFRYIANPIKARPGDFVRVYFLNAGPNLISTFHLVGIVWDFAYWQGMPNPENVLVGGQTVLAGPSDSWVVDFRIPPDEGPYLIVTHAFGSTTRGAIGVLNAAKDNERSPTILASGPEFTPGELEKLKEGAVRTISPFHPGSDELANPYRLPSGENKMRISIIGNSFHPKVVEVPVGTTIEWTNEEVFTFFEGEFSGLHDVKTYEGPEEFWSPMLGHAEKWSITLNERGEYKYFCTPHPYMEGIIRVQ